MLEFEQPLGTIANVVVCLMSMLRIFFHADAFKV